MIDYNNIPRHPWFSYKNQHLNWVNEDSHEAWQKNMQDPERKKVLEKYGWDDPNVISYKFNSAGFRCDEFNENPALVTLGCSFTGGLALPYDHIWPTVAAKKLGLQLCNLGVPGIGMDTCFRLLNFYINKLNTKIVCLLRPSQDRFEVVRHDGKIVYVHPMSTFSVNEQIWYQHENNLQQNFIKNTMAIQYLCHVNQAKLVILDLYDDLFNTPPRDPWPPARDLAHVGTVEHAECARRFIAACEQS